MIPRGLGINGIVMPLTVDSGTFSPEVRFRHDSVEKLGMHSAGPVLRGHSTLAEVAIVDPGSI
jgi:hypothetical protein